MRRFLIALVVGATAFVVSAAGASVLDLTGSESAPGSGKAEAACAGPLTITNPVTQGGHDNNRVTHVDITGDMTRCEGQTMLVEVDLDSIGATHAYAILQFPNATTTSVSMTFNETTGDFRDTAPTVAGGTLTPTGVQLAPIRAKDFGLVTLTIAKSWE